MLPPAETKPLKVGLQNFFDEVVAAGEEQLLAHPERLVELAGWYGTGVLGEYPAPNVMIAICAGIVPLSDRESAHTPH